MSKNLKSWFWADSLRVDHDPYFTLDHDGGLVVDTDALLASDKYQLQLEGARMLESMAISDDHVNIREPRPIGDQFE